MNLSLRSIFCKPESISNDEIRALFSLMEKYYNNVAYNNFLNDLFQKDVLLLLKNYQGEIKGFTSVKIYEFNLKNKLIKIVYSGDTIVDKTYTWEFELHKSWGNYVFGLVACDSNIEYYWILLSKGPKTYKFLPTYFKSFYPSVNEPIPSFEEEIIHAFGKFKFPVEFDPLSGIVYNYGNRDFLKSQEAIVTKSSKKNKHTQFFLSKNPDYSLGNELVCITKLSFNNLKKSYNRFLYR